MYRISMNEGEAPTILFNKGFVANSMDIQDAIEDLQQRCKDRGLSLPLTFFIGQENTVVMPMRMNSYGDDQ